MNNIASLVGNPNIIILIESHDIHTNGTLQRVMLEWPSLPLEPVESLQSLQQESESGFLLFSSNLPSTKKRKNFKRSLLHFLALPLGLGGTIEMIVSDLGLKKEMGASIGRTLGWLRFTVRSRLPQNRLSSRSVRFPLCY